METVSIVNQKGGVGKTTTSVHLALALSRRGKKVLAVDMDPQANLSITFGIVPVPEAPISIYEVLDPESPTMIGSAHRETRFPNIRLVYGHIAMSALDQVRSYEPARMLLKKIDAATRSNFDFMIIDCPPALSLPTVNALATSDSYIVPIKAGDFYALYGMDLLNQTILGIKKQVNPRLRLRGVLLTMYDGRLNVCKVVEEEVRNLFEPLEGGVFKTRIHQNTVAEKAVLMKKVIHEVDRNAISALDYNGLAKEILGEQGNGEAETADAVAAQEAGR